MTGLAPALKEAEPPRQRAHTGRELYSIDSFAVFKGHYKPIAERVLRRASLIRVLQEAGIDVTSSLGPPGDTDPASELELERWELLAFTHHLKPQPVHPLTIRSTAIQLAFDALPLAEQKRYNDAADMEKIVGATARKQQKEQKKKLKRDPEALAEPISIDLLKQYAHSPSFLRPI